MKKRDNPYGPRASSQCDEKGAQAALAASEFFSRILGGQKRCIATVYGWTSNENDKTTASVIGTQFNLP